MSKERQRITQKRIKRVKREMRPEEEVVEVTSKDQLFFGLKPNTQLYYVKVVSGVIFGLITGLAISLLSFEPTLIAIIGMLSAVSIAAGIGRFLLKISVKDLDWKRLWFAGTFTCILLLIVSSSLVWMVLSPIR